jgi:SWI/SNF-related matrix-associated actin-dependent regulator 1 of chromatin subfamily A
VQVKTSRPKLKLMPFQEDAVRTLLTTISKKNYLAYDQGLGKTIIAATYCYNLGLSKLLVVCPASIRLNWKREIKLWGGEKLNSIQAILSNKDVEDLNGTIIVSYDMLNTSKKLRNYIRDTHFDAVIFDEAHYMRSMAAKRTNICMAIAQKTERVLYMSGTPLVSSAIDLFPSMFDMIPEIPEAATFHDICLDFKSFASRYAYIHRTQYGIKYSGVRNLGEFKRMLFDTPVMFRKTKEEVLEDLPDKTYTEVEVDIKINAKDYDGLDEDLRRNNEVTLKFRKDLGILKASNPQVKEYIESFLKRGEPVVIFAWHTSVIDTLMEVFKKYKPVLIDGRVSPSNKQKAVDDFQSGKSKVFIGQLAAASVGITLTKAANAFYVELDYLPTTILQSVDRLHRIGQKYCVTGHFFTTSHKLEKSVIRGMLERLRTIKRVGL